MKKLAILRHAKSSWAKPGMSDKERPLNARGRQQLVAVTQWMKNNSFEPNKVLCSPALRTQQTAEGLSQAIGEADFELVPQLYNGPIELYLDALWALSYDTECALLIAHNPTCDELARYLTHSDSPAFEKLMKSHFGTAAIAVFDVTVENWSQLAKATGVLTSMVRPKDIEKGLAV